MTLAFTIIFTIITFAIFGFAIYKAVRLVKNPMPNLLNYGLEVKKLGFLTGAVGISSVVLFTFLSMNNGYPLNSGEWAMLIFGAFIFAVCGCGALLSFIVHYYGKKLPQKIDKGLYISMITTFVVMFLGLVLLTNSFADYLRYPLVNAFSFKYGVITPQSTDKSASIAFYALFILGGALITYFIADHRFYQEYGKHGILESTLYIALPAGILGARIGYVIGNWNGDVTKGVESFAERCARGEWWSIFAIWEGGLTILAGAAAGIIAGVLWFKFRKKEYSIWLAMDVVVPAILVAQAVGRWGNFFNCEVHGLEVAASDWWILPKIIVNNSKYSVEVGWAQPGNIFLPLFIIEGTLNLAAYFLIRYGLGEGVKKYIEPGDLAASYLFAYGLIRVVLEPTRHPAFNMGTDGFWSWFWSFFFIVAGALLVCVNHLVRYFVENKKGTYIVLKDSFKNGLIASGGFVLPGLALTIIGIVLMSTSTFAPILAYNRYNNGLLLLLLGISLLMMLGVTLPYVMCGKKACEK